MARHTELLGGLRRRLRRQPTAQLLKRLGDDIDAIIAQEQKERDDTDQMAVIMQLIHTKGHNDVYKRILDK